MKSVLKGIILTLVTAIVVVVGGAYLISPVAQVERAIVIQAPPGATHGAIHQRVLSIILLNTMYAGFFGQEQHSRIHADPNFPSELLDRFFVRS